MSFHWIDPTRDELETRAPEDVRELMVHVFYPADGVSGNPASYVPDADVMRGVWSAEQLERIAAMLVFSRDMATPAGRPERFPVAIFLPGGGLKVLTYHALIEDLASHGWVVAAIDPPYNARALRLPDGRVLGNLALGARGWPEPQSDEEQLRFYRERNAHWSRDVSFVIDQLAALDAGDGLLANRLDLGRGVGVVGHSRGGQASGTVRLIDGRVRGGINLDGAIGDTPIQPLEGNDSSGTQPFLWIQKPLPEPPTDEELEEAGYTRAQYDALIAEILAAWDRGLSEISGGAMLVYLDRSEINHIDFSDEPYWDGSMTPSTRPGKVRTIGQTRKWIRAFLDGTVRGRWDGLKALVREAGSPTADMSVNLFGQMWP
jgi:hypothetical protein